MTYVFDTFVCYTWKEIMNCLAFLLMLLMVSMAKNLFLYLIRFQ